MLQEGAPSGGDRGIFSRLRGVTPGRTQGFLQSAVSSIAAWPARVIPRHCPESQAPL
jgi:hypothetical protein